MGYFNEDLKKSQHPVHDSFINLNYQQVICKPTTISGTTIDHIYVYKVETIYTAGVMSSYNWYHEPIYITFKSDDEAAFYVDPMKLSSETPDSSININQSVSTVKSNHPEPSVITNQSKSPVKR